MFDGDQAYDLWHARQTLYHWHNAPNSSDSNGEITLLLIQRPKMLMSLLFKMIFFNIETLLGSVSWRKILLSFFSLVIKFLFEKHSLGLVRYLRGWRCLPPNQRPEFDLWTERTDSWRLCPGLPAPSVVHAWAWTATVTSPCQINTLARYSFLFPEVSSFLWDSLLRKCAVGKHCLNAFISRNSARLTLRYIERLFQTQRELICSCISYCLNLLGLSVSAALWGSREPWRGLCFSVWRSQLSLQSLLPSDSGPLTVVLTECSSGKQELWIPQTFCASQKPLEWKVFIFKTFGPKCLFASSLNDWYAYITVACWRPAFTLIHLKMNPPGGAPGWCWWWHMVPLSGTMRVCVRAQTHGEY